MRIKATQQISPKAAAAVILGALIVIQVFWWRGLVMKEKPADGGPQGGGGGPPGKAPPILPGREDVRTDTMSGGLDAGDADGSGAVARFDNPVGLTIDAQGNLYVADSKNHRIRRVAPNGVTATVAGGAPGFADGPAAKAQFQTPCGVAVAPNGVLYVADTGNHRIRRIQDGQVTTLAGGAPGFADGQGNAVRFNMPCALTYIGGATPALYVADALNRRVRILSLTGQTLGSRDNSAMPTAALDVPLAVRAGLLAPNGAPKAVPMELNGLEAKQEEFMLRRPLAICPTPGGLFAIDAKNNGVFYVSEGRAELLAGRCLPQAVLSGWQDQRGNRAFFGRLGGIAADGKGRIYVCDTGNNVIRRIFLPEGWITGRGTQP
jgi:hypothetical protein